MEDLGFEVILDSTYSDALERVTAVLKTEGFGVLTKIDVQATLKEKLGVEFRPYAILGACNPPLAHKALAVSPTVGLMLPCNITVESLAECRVCIRIANPESMLMVGKLAENDSLKQVAAEARSRLERVAALLGQTEASITTAK